MTRAVSILIAAMGGEGGGVLADWLITAANEMGFPVQSTSVPGVAQRTGATTYYVEIFPVPRRQLAGREPVLALTPTPGHVDLVAASELVEAARSIQNGYVAPEHTALVASTHREYAVSEKSAMGDGRHDSSSLLEAARAMAQDSFLFDMSALARAHGTVINTVLFGAMARSGRLPFPREVCERAIVRSGKSVKASLRGFAAGFDWVPSHTAPGQSSAAPAGQRVATLPGPLRAVVAAGVAHTADFQDAAYASLYLDRVERVLARERASADGGRPGFAVTRETARYLALWMAFEDVMRVADLKSRRERLNTVRLEVGAKEGEPLYLTEFMKPGLEELCSVLPASMAAWVRRAWGRRTGQFHKGVQLRTHTIHGFLLLVMLRSLRPLRRRMSRFALEQEAIERWLRAIERHAQPHPDLALQLALCGNLVKGYGETSERGHRNLHAILDALPDDCAVNAAAVTDRVRRAREAALADPEGRSLADTLGMPRPEPKAQPIRIVRRTAPAAEVR